MINGRNIGTVTAESTIQTKDCVFDSLTTVRKHFNVSSKQLLVGGVSWACLRLLYFLDNVIGEIYPHYKFWQLVDVFLENTDVLLSICPRVISVRTSPSQHSLVGYFRDEHSILEKKDSDDRNTTDFAFPFP